MFHKKALVTLALILTLIGTTPLLAQGAHRQMLVEQVVNSPRDPHSGVISPRDSASGLPTGIVAPRDANSGGSGG